MWTTTPLHVRLNARVTMKRLHLLLAALFVLVTVTTAQDPTTTTEAPSPPPPPPPSPPPTTSTTTAASLTTYQATASGMLDINWNNVPAEPQETKVKVTAPGACTCDAQEGACTANCCCDADCSASEKSLFSFCLPEGINTPQLEYCVADSAVAEVNLPSSSSLAAVRKVEAKDEFFAATLMCILQDNNPLLGRFFKDPGPASSTTLATALAETKTSFARTTTLAQSDSKYKVGAGLPILRKLPNGMYTRGDFLNIPSAGLAGTSCDASTRLGFMQSEPSWRGAMHAQDLSTIADGCFVAASPGACTSGSVLDVTLYTTDLLIAKTPLASPLIDGASSTSAIMTPGSDYANITLGSLMRRSSSSTGKPTAAGAAYFDDAYTSELSDAVSPSIAGGTCRDVLTQFEYIVYHDGSGTVTSVQAHAVVSDVPLGSSVRVTFAARFYTSAQQRENARPQSGSPGYITGRPVLAGASARDAATAKNAVSQFPGGFPLMRALPMGGGLCAFGNSLSAVAFGADTAASCSVPMSENALRSFCQGSSGGMSLQGYYLQLLAGSGSAFPSGSMSLPFQVLYALTTSTNGTYVGRWGNSMATNVADWVKVESSGLTSTKAMSWDGSELSCSNVVTGVDVVFLTALVGDADTPQSKISYVTLKPVYGTWRWRRGGAGGLQQQSFQLIQTVRFVPQVQGDAGFVRPASPPLSSPLPGDFFYPFLTSAASSKTSTPPLLFVAFMSLLAASSASSCSILHNRR
ncbi:tectonic protein [Pseudoscourfieldia marina]